MSAAHSHAHTQAHTQGRSATRGLPKSAPSPGRAGRAIPAPRLRFRARLIIFPHIPWNKPLNFPHYLYSAMLSRHFYYAGMPIAYPISAMNNILPPWFRASARRRRGRSRMGGSNTRLRFARARQLHRGSARKNGRPFRWCFTGGDSLAISIWSGPAAAVHAKARPLRTQKKKFASQRKKIKNSRSANLFC